MKTVWRFTGNPENWLTAIGIGKWALNEHNKPLWERDIRPGDVVLFHSTQKSDFSDHAVSSIIGFGYVGTEMVIKDELWWVQEVQDHENHWPYVVPLEEIYLFSDTRNIDFTTPVDKKPKLQVITDIDVFLTNAVAVSALNAKAKEVDPNCPNFPVNASASRLNKLYEELILERNEDFFVPQEQQSTDLLEEALSESIDERLSKMDMTTILAQAKQFDNRNAESHSIAHGPKKVRKESQIQKRRVAALESHRCQLCGFRYQYLRKNGKPGWIIHVDHIQDKAAEGMENLANLWVLCPNCHAKKTCGAINIDPETKTVREGENEIKLLQDNHLFVG
jgi:HNH endonuclease